MYYERRFFIPPRTPISAPVVEIVPIHAGVLRSLSLEFPAGCCGLAHVQVYYWERQVFPSNPDSNLSGDDVQIVIHEDIDVIDPPYELVLVGWNEDDLYQHGPIFRAEIVSFDRSTLAMLAGLFGGTPLSISEGR